MSGFLSAMLGRKASEVQLAEKSEGTTVYDTKPRLQAPPGLHTDPTPGPTTDEQAVVDYINQHRQELLADLPAEPESGPQFNADGWLDDTQILLYVRANKGDKERTRARLRSTLEWHCTFRPHAITPETVRNECATGKQYVNGYDREGHPLVYMYSQRQNTKDAQGHLRLIVFTMEQALRSMPSGVTKLTMVIDVSKYSMSQAVALSTAREFLRILEGHYPERLNKALVLSPPSYFVMFYRLVAPFIDPVTKAKIAFVDVDGGRGKTSDDAEAAKPDSVWARILDYVAPDQLQYDAGGEWKFRFEQNSYWPELERSYQQTSIEN
ncbi:hypothetical protein GGF46_002673 [Coemansia sp. RSA 552]|nr:hypothetical protein GGF46_002673 [Coemansia sp. RSA 552]